MTANPGQLTTRQAVLGGLAILAILAGILAALGLLLDRDAQIEPLQGPADPEELVGPQGCPEPGDPSVTITADALIECPRTYDQQIVRYRGEAVRAVLPRGERAWVHLNDDPYALDLGPLPAHRLAVGANSGIPVSIPLDVADDITHVGDAHHQGDILDIEGVFHRAHPADGGGPAIQARTATIHQTGRRVARPVSPPLILTAITVAMIALASTIAVRSSGK